MIQATKPTRIAADLADMIGEIVEHRGGSSAEILDPLIRGPIERLYGPVRPLVEALEETKRAYAIPELGVGD